MIQWFSMLAGWMLADVLWWRVADRRLRPLKGAKAWRWLLGLFVGAQVGFILMMASGSIVDHIPQRGPLLWPVAAYVWHLFVLPAAVMGLVLAHGVRWMRRRGRAQVPVEAQVAQGLEQKPRLTRRQALAAGGVPMPPPLTMGGGGGAGEKPGGLVVR